MGFIEDARKRLHAPKKPIIDEQTILKMSEFRMRAAELQARGIPLDSEAGNRWLGNLCVSNPKLYGVITE